MRKFKCYMAGRMQNLSFEDMNSWREKATLLLKEKSDNMVHTENPCHFYNFKRDPNTYTEKEVKEFDLHLVKNCDIMLVNLDFADSIGTAIELHMAHDVWGIPVIAFREEHNKSHPWIDLSVTKFCKTLEEAIDHIMEFYFPNVIV